MPIKKIKKIVAIRETYFLSKLICYIAWSQYKFHFLHGSSMGKYFDF